MYSCCLFQVASEIGFGIGNGGDVGEDQGESVFGQPGAVEQDPVDNVYRIIVALVVSLISGVLA